MTDLSTHLYCMRLIRALEEAAPGRPIGVYFANAQRYASSRLADAATYPPGRYHHATNDDATFFADVLRHLKAGCPAPKLYSPTTLPAMCGGLTLHA